MRVYVPATVAGLRELHEHGALDALPITAFAVTPALREWYLNDDLEELEYAALSEAARASLRLVDAEPGAVARRVVVAADVPDGQVEVRDDLDRGVVRVATAVPIAAVAALHVDDREAEATIRAAAAVVLEADLGSSAAQDVVDDAEGFELGWYANQEITHLIAED